MVGIDTNNSIDRSKGFRRLPCALLCISLFVFAASVSILYVGTSHGDDTFIYMRYADHLIRHGLVEYNLGEKSDGITSQVHFWIMTCISFIFGNTIDVWKLSTSLIYGLAIALAFLSFKLLEATSFTAATCAVFLSFEPHLLRWSGTGMENSLVACTFCALLFFHVSKSDNTRQNIFFGSLLGLAAGVRPELLIFSIFYIPIALVTRRPGAKILLAAAIVTTLLVAGTNYLATGFALPQTSAAKSIFLARPFRLATLIQIPLIIASGSSISIILITKWIAKSREFTHWVSAVAAYVVFVIAYLFYTHALISTRYATSLSFPLLLSALYGICSFGELGSRSSALAKAFLIIQAFVSAAVLWYFFPFTRVSEQDEIRRFSLRTNEITAQSDRVALTEIGIFGFYSNRYIIDLVGLTDPQTVAWGRVNGRPDTIQALERLLKFRRATYYVCAFCQTESDLQGREVEFVPVYSQKILRGNGSGGRKIDTSLWVLYKIKYRSNALRESLLPQSGHPKPPEA